MASVKIGDIAGLVNNNRTVIVIDADTGNEAARYDGRNSIPEEMNDWEIIEINVEDGALVITA